MIVEELYYAKRLGHSFCEVPVRLTSRSSDQRPSLFAYKPGVILRYLKYAVWAGLGISRPSSLRPCPPKQENPQT